MSNKDTVAVLDAQEGGEWEGFEIEADPNRVHGVAWANGAKIETFFYADPVQGLNQADRIKLKITDCNNEVKEWHLNPDDALEIVEGLTMALKQCFIHCVPYNVDD